MTDVGAQLTELNGHARGLAELLRQTRIERQREQEKLRGIKWMRLPEILSAKVSAGAINLGESTGYVLGPRQGYIWSLQALVVTGLTAGTTPDVVDLYIGTRAPIFWQFNGNNFGYTFGKLQRTLMGGETLTLQNSGALAATGQITLSGEVLEVPAEMMGKLI